MRASTSKLRASTPALTRRRADGPPAAPAAYKVITVQSHRAVPDAAAVRLGIRHQTPQAILLRDGRPVWNASHFRITAGQLDKAIT